MKASNIFRVVTMAVVLSTLSFAAGVAGDLSQGPTSGARVVLRIPPQLPPDTVRAAPLALVSTPTAAAREIVSDRIDLIEVQLEDLAPLDTPSQPALARLPKPDAIFTPKHESIHAA